MEANMMAIRDPAAEAAERTVRSPLDRDQHRVHQNGLQRIKAAYRSTQHALHGDERRGGKTAKLLDLYARLKFGAL
jgi:hypothetical protein